MKIPVTDKEYGLFGLTGPQATDLCKRLHNEYNKRKTFKHLNPKIKKYRSDNDLNFFLFYITISCGNYSDIEREMLFETFLSMPPSVAKVFDSLFTKFMNSDFDHKLYNYKNAIKKAKEIIKSNKNFENLRGENSKHKENIIILQNRIKELEDVRELYNEEQKKRDKKLGHYTPLFREIDSKLFNNPYMKKEDAIIYILDKHLQLKDNEYLNELSEKHDNNFNKILLRFKPAYYNFKRRHPYHY